MAKRHHLITVPSGMIASVIITLQYVSAEAKDLWDAGETTQACMTVIEQILSIF